MAWLDSYASYYKQKPGRRRSTEKPFLLKASDDDPYGLGKNDSYSKFGDSLDTDYFNDLDFYSSPRAKGLRPVEDFSRFEQMPKQDRPSPRHEPHEHKKIVSKRGKLARFFRNGDPHFKGVTVSVSQKCFATIETLLVWLNEKIPTTAGVRYIFIWPEGKEIKDVTGFIGGKSYVVSSTKKLNKEINYGIDSRESFWSNKKASAGKLRKGEEFLYKHKNGVPNSPQSVKPRVLTIISNTNRESVEKVMLNPMTNETFEEMLEDIQDMVLVDRPPVVALYTAKAPHKRILSFSQLFRDFKDHDTFLACGKEGYPYEAMQKRQAASSNSSNESIVNNYASPRKPRKMQRKADIQLIDYESVDSFIQPESPRVYQPPQPAAAAPSTTTHAPVAPPARHARKHPGRFQNIPDPSRSVTPWERTNNSHFGAKSKSSKGFEVVRVDIHGNRREFFSPSSTEKQTTERPDKKFRLDWVYGYRGRDARSNIYVLPSGELLYYVASVAVIFNKNSESQRHYTGHNEDISSMSLHPNQIYVATGQLAGETAETAAHVRIWDSKTLATYSILGLGFFQCGLSCVNFSLQSDGDYLMAIDDGEKHTLSVWRWAEERHIAKSILDDDTEFAQISEDTSTETVVWGSFHPDDDAILITFGKQHIYFWKIFVTGKKGQAPKIMRDKKSGIFFDEIPKYVTSIAFSPNGDVITGDSNGRIVVWNRGINDTFTMDQSASEYMRHAHRKSVFALCVMDDGTLLSGGGNEIRVWDTVNGFRHVKERTLPDTSGYIRSLIPHHTGAVDGHLYIGTTKNTILEGSMQNKFRYVVQGHSEELWALAVYHEEHAFVTAGYDLNVCKWSAVSHRLLWKVVVEKPCLSSAVHPKGKIVGLGTTVGRLIILNGQNGMHMTSIQIGTDGITIIKFSPDGSMLAVGTQDGSIYVYHVLDNGQFFRKHKEGVHRGHNNFVMHMDWSHDNRYLQTVSGDYDLSYWNVLTLQQEKQAKEMRDIDWHTHTCVLGYNVLGAWSNLEHEEDINTVCRSNYQDYLAVGDNCGKVRLYKYPCSAHKPDFYEKKNYTGHVTNVQFMFDDSFLISAGGVDAGLLQWTLVDQTSQQ